MQDSLQQFAVSSTSLFTLPVILTGILVIVTISYAYFTFRMMKSSEKAVAATRESIDALYRQMEAAMRPYIDFELRRYPDSSVYLHIKNSGKMNAEKLSLSIDKDFHPLGERGRKQNLKESTLFKNGVDSFTPGTEITVGMLYITEIGKQETVSPAKFKITARYAWAGRKHPVVEENEIDLTSFVGSGLIPKPDLLYEVHEIKRILKNLVDQIGRFMEDSNNSNNL